MPIPFQTPFYGNRVFSANGKQGLSKVIELSAGGKQELHKVIEFLVSGKQGFS